MRVIVGYGSSQGSTAQIAERIAEILRDSGNTVDVRPVQKIDRPGDYEAAVLGSALHNQAWLPEAAAFLHTHAPVLAGRPVWLFSVGMSDGLPKPIRGMARSGQEKRIAQSLRGDVQPRGHRLFSGVCQPWQLPRAGRILFRAAGGRFGDYRDWPAIESWARDIAQDIKHATGPVNAPGH
jgi:menaquinone-dependent protoporphyrinogen oxidase